MKGDFIVKFIKAVIDIGIEVHDIWNWQTIYYKGIKVSGYDRKKAYSGFKNLERRGIIEKSGARYKFTKTGKGWLESSRIKYFKLQNKKWDGNWRVVIFDIPQEFRRNRNILRRRLRWWGLHMLQKSVFVSPYPCEEELGGLCSQLKLSDYVDVIVAKHIGSREKEMRNYFKI